MFKHYIVKGTMILMMLCVLTACASVSSFTSRPAGSDAIFQPSPVALPALAMVDVELPVPVVEFEEVSIPLQVKALHERAVVHMTESEIQCMAKVMYFEARGEGSLGMAAVGYVVLNRMAHARYPDTVCTVVYDRNRRGCQFSWVCDGIPDVIRNQRLFAEAREIAVDVMSTRMISNPIDDSIYFRHHRVRSRYASSQRLVAQVGQHKFFRQL